MSFLEEVASFFSGRDDLAQMCFVFPNRRSSLFFQRYLGLTAGRPVFLPKTITINDLFCSLSDLEPADRISALSILHKQYVELMPLHEGQKSESFDSFLFWGDILLSDFDDMDKYLVRTDKLLRNVKDLRDLSVDYDFLSDNQKEAIAEFCRNFNPDSRNLLSAGDKKRLFAETWDILLPLYENFKACLRKEGKAYEGMIYREVAENMDVSSLKKKYSQIVFVGLNALNECEKVLLTAIHKEGFGDFYWDFSGKMLTDPANRAGDFIRENISRYPSCHKLTEIDDNLPQHFEVISCPSAVGQTRVASSIISGLVSEAQNGLMDTAVVLPDESLLFPMLNAIPETVGKINVTMGCSLSSSNVSGFCSTIESLQNNARIKNGRPRFYHRDVTDMLEHPFFLNAVEDRESVEALKASIIKDNIIFLDENLLSEQSSLFGTVFRYVESPADMSEYLISIVDAVQSGQDKIEREFLYHFRKAVESLSEADIDFVQMERRTYFRLLDKYMSLISVPYNGEPLGGLQIMGPLETRALDFSNMVILSAGEGVFPSKTVSASFIPYNLRLGFGLPTYEYQDSLAAYYFYRSISRAGKIFLIYDSRSEGLQSGEESRYIKQLKYHYELPLVEKSAAYALSSETVEFREKEVLKTPEIMAELKDLFINGRGVFSATSLNDYLDCPLCFYYKNVKGLRQAKEVVEELDSSLFGSVFHKTMEMIYSPFRGRVVTAADIAGISDDKRNIEKTVASAFKSEALIGEIEGRNLILRDVIVRYVARTLELDAGMAPFTLIGTEKKEELLLQLPGTGLAVRLFGYIDRLDSNIPGIVRVVDYKTGKVDRKDDCRNVEDLFDKDYDKRPRIAFQLYFYTLLLTDKYSSAHKLRYDPCIYSLREFFDAVPPSYTISPEKLDIFRARLISLIEEIFDKDKPFAGRSTNGKVCEYCDFKKLCGK